MCKTVNRVLEVTQPWRSGVVVGTCQRCYHSEGKEISYAEFYFKCAGRLHVNSDQTAPPLTLVKSNLGEVACLACTESLADPVVVFDCRDRHVACVDCFRQAFF